MAITTARTRTNSAIPALAVIMEITTGRTRRAWRRTSSPRHFRRGQMHAHGLVGVHLLLIAGDGFLEVEQCSGDAGPGGYFGGVDVLCHWRFAAGDELFRTGLVC